MHPTLDWPTTIADPLAFFVTQPLQVQLGWVPIKELLSMCLYHVCVFVSCMTYVFLPKKNMTYVVWLIPCDTGSDVKPSKRGTTVEVPHLGTNLIYYNLLLEVELIMLSF